MKIKKCVRCPRAADKIIPPVYAVGITAALIASGLTMTVCKKQLKNVPLLPNDRYEIFVLATSTAPWWKWTAGKVPGEINIETGGRDSQKSN